MIKAKPWDIGRSVIFRPKRSPHHLGGFKSADEFVQEEGVLVEIERDYYDTVLVKYNGEREPRRTRADCLSWKDT